MQLKTNRISYYLDQIDKSIYSYEKILLKSYFRYLLYLVVLLLTVWNIYLHVIIKYQHKELADQYSSNSIDHKVQVCRALNIYNYITKDKFVVHNIVASTYNNQHDITLITQLSYSKLNNINTQVLEYNGPISIVIYVSKTDKFIKVPPKYNEDGDIVESEIKINKNMLSLKYKSIFASLASIYHEVLYDILSKIEHYLDHPIFLRYVTLSIVTTDLDLKFYPINILRNIAWDAVKTNYIFHLDSDYMPMKNLHFTLSEELNIEYKSMQVYIVPSLELKGFVNYPENWEEIQNCFNVSCTIPAPYWKSAYYPINYDRWIKSDHMYSVNYENWFEPYIIVENSAPRFDDYLFYGAMNKAAHILELKLSGYEFKVLPKVFVTQKNEGERNNFWKTKANSKLESSFVYNALFLERLRKNGQISDDDYQSLVYYG